MLICCDLKFTCHMTIWEYSLKHVRDVLCWIGWPVTDYTLQCPRYFSFFPPQNQLISTSMSIVFDWFTRLRAAQNCQKDRHQCQLQQAGPQELTCIEKACYGFRIGHLLLPFHLRFQSLFSHVGLLSFCIFYKMLFS